MLLQAGDDLEEVCGGGIALGPKTSVLMFRREGVYSVLSAYERDGGSRALIPPAMASTQAWGYTRGPIICSTEGLRKEPFCYLGALIGLLFRVLKRIT
jgi:hypothetical protein